MEEIARVLTRHPPSERRPAALPAQVAVHQGLHSVRAELLGWFAALAEHLVATLEQSGLVRCPGRARRLSVPWRKQLPLPSCWAPS
jgi:hypothetical protein